MMRYPDLADTTLCLFTSWTVYHRVTTAVGVNNIGVWTPLVTQETTLVLGLPRATT